jgi:hypothetical protein
VKVSRARRKSVSFRRIRCETLPEGGRGVLQGGDPLPKRSHHLKVKGARLRTVEMDLAGSQLIFLGRDGAPVGNQAFNVRIKLACQHDRASVISAHRYAENSRAMRAEREGSRPCSLRLRHPGVRSR